MVTGLWVVTGMARSAFARSTAAARPAAHDRVPGSGSAENIQNLCTAARQHGDGDPLRRDRSPEGGVSVEIEITPVEPIKATEWIGPGI